MHIVLEAKLSSNNFAEALFSQSQVWPHFWEQFNLVTQYNSPTCASLSFLTATTHSLVTLDRFCAVNWA